MNLDEMFKKYDNMSKEEKQKLYDSMPEADKKIFKEKMDFMTNHFHYILLARGKPTLENVGMFGHVVTEFCEKFKCAPIDFIEFAQVFNHVFMEKSIQNLGVYFDDVHGVPKRLQKQNRENKMRMDKEENQESSKYTLGDYLKAKGIAI